MRYLSGLLFIVIYRGRCVMIVLFTLTTTIDNIDTNYNISLANNTHYHTQPPPVYTVTMIISTTTLQPLHTCRGGPHTVLLDLHLHDAHFSSLQQAMILLKFK